MTTYALYVSFPLNKATIGPDTRKVEKLLKKLAGGSGGGMGRRDVEFYYKTKEERDAARKKANEAGYQTSILDDLQEV